MTVQITIIGLGRVGASFGLALASQKNQMVRIGHDRNPEIARRAEKMGAVDKVNANLHRSVENADVVLLAIPVDEIEETLRQIGPDLKPECVVVDAGPQMVAPARWAAELLPQGRYFAALSPAVKPEYLLDHEKGIDAAHADRFKGSLAVITTPTGASAEVLQLLTDLASLVETYPFFADPLEFDGLMASVDLLPRLSAAALMNAVSDQPGWKESRKLAGEAFAIATEPASRPLEYADFGAAAHLNRDNALRALDHMIAALQEIRQTLTADDPAALKEVLGRAMDSRKEWLNQRERGNYEKGEERPQIPSAGEMMGRLIGWRSKRKDGK